MERLNTYLTKAMPIMTPICVILGVILASYLKDYSFLVPWVFAFMTFSGSLSSNFKSFTEVLKHPVPIITALIVLHIVMPLFALMFGHLFFSHDIHTITGLVLGMIIPTGITSFIWVSIYKGNIATTLAIILIDTMLSPFIVPFSLHILFGQKVEMDTMGITSGMFWMVVVPSIVGMVLNHVTKGKINKTLGKTLSPFSKLCVGITVLLNGAVIAPYLSHINLKLILIAITVFFIALLGYWISFFSGVLIKKDKSIVISLLFSGGMRNNAAGAVLAVTYFPPAVAVPVVLCMLFNQILASTNGHLINSYFNRTKKRKLFFES